MSSNDYIVEKNTVCPSCEEVSRNYIDASKKYRYRITDGDVLVEILCDTCKNKEGEIEIKTCCWDCGKRGTLSTARKMLKSEAFSAKTLEGEYLIICGECPEEG